MRKLIKKICLLGEECVGKTSLTRRYVHNSFSDDYKSTIGVSLSQKSIKSIDEVKHLMIWDLEGNRSPEDYPADYIHGAHASLVVADITRQETFAKAFEFAKLFLNLNKGAVCLLALNKVDLLPEQDVDQIIAQLNLGINFERNIFSEIVPSSAKFDINVEQIFQKLVGVTDE